MKKQDLVRTCFAIILGGPAVALGAVHPTVLAVFMAVTILFFFYAAFLKRGYRYMRVDLPSALFLILIVAAALQLIPLPAPVVKTLSPNAHAIHLGSMDPLGGPEPSYMPLTLDPTLTLMDLGRLMLLFMVYLICTWWARRHGPKFIIQSVVGTGVIVAAIFLGHRIAFADLVYGFYQPKHTYLTGEAMFAPLLNPNHLAAVLGMATAIGIGYALEVRTRANRILLIIITVLMGGSLFLTLSRGGIAAFFAGQAVFLLYRVLSRSKSAAIQTSSAGLIGIFIALAGIGLFATQDALIKEFAGGDLEKLQLYKESVPLIAGYPLFGVGKGAFGVGFVQVSDYGPTRIFTHPENAILQLIADFGVILGSAALIIGFIVFYRILRMSTTRPRNLAAIAALSAFGLHNLVDFNMEVTGPALLAVAVLATQTSRKGYRLTQKRVWPRTVLAAWIPVALVTCLAVGLYLPSRHLDNEQRKLHKALIEQDLATFETPVIEKTLKRHPADWYIPFAAGVFHYHNNTDDPLPWLQRALTLHPGAASARFYLGRHLLNKKRPSRALEQFRQAINANPGLLTASCNELVLAMPSFDLLRKLAVAGSQKKQFLPAIADALARHGHLDEANKADEEVLKIVATHPGSLTRRAQLLARQKRFREAVSLATRLREQESHEIQGTILLAQLAAQEQDFVKAIGLLEQALENHPREMGLLRHLASVHARAGNEEESIQATIRLVSVSPNERIRARSLVFKGDIHVRFKRLEEALTHYRAASFILPRDIGILTKIATVAERNGNLARAFEALKRLQSEEPQNKTWNERLDRVRLKQLTQGEP